MAARKARKGAPPKRGRMQSKAQHRWAFANRMPWAKSAAKAGRYRGLPERKS